MKTINTAFKALSENELRKVIGGETIPVPTPTPGGPCGSGETGGFGGGMGTGSSGPTLSNGDSPGVSTGVVTNPRGNNPMIPCSPPLIKFGPLI